jgi:hypothetical protein
VPRHNRTAWLDFLGTHGLWWQQTVLPTIFDLTGVAVVAPGISDGGGDEWLAAVQRQYTDACEALGIEPPPDLTSYDLRRASDHASWTFLLSQSAKRIQFAAGIP